MLCKELDKLRDKTLSFGLIVRHRDTDIPYILMGIEYPELLCGNDEKYFRLCHADGLFSEHQLHIDGHPLTRGRIEYLKKLMLIYYTSSLVGLEYNNIERQNKSHLCHEFHGVCGQIVIKFDENIERYNQSEIERQTHEKRPELKQLLIHFSNYL